MNTEEQPVSQEVTSAVDDMVIQDPPVSAVTFVLPFFRGHNWGGPFESGRMRVS
jgi:hypothetical protein